jgi:hypothetical protein
MTEPGTDPRLRTPEDVRQDPGLTDAQRADLLRRWAFDELQVAVAVDEGMPGPDPQLLGRILRVLGNLERPERAIAMPPYRLDAEQAPG